MRLKSSNGAASRVESPTHLFALGGRHGRFLCCLARAVHASDYRWLCLIAEFDRRQTWGKWAFYSCAHWLNYACGLDLGAARERVRAARALEGLPKIAAAMSRGELSFSKVRAITRVATPATEDTLLMIGLHGTAHQVERVVRGFRQALEAAELSRAERQYETRTVTWFYDDDGSLLVKARLPAEAGAAFIRAMDIALDSVPEKRATTPDVAAETRERLGARRADALGVMAESLLAHGIEMHAGGDRQQIVVHVDAGTLRGTDDTCCGERCELEDGPGLAAATAQRMACDASVVRILEDADGNPLDVGRKTRTVPPALRRALRSRDKGCRFPGCAHDRFIDAHHIEHWAHGGETKLGNLVSLCRFHHRCVHEGKLGIERRDDGALHFVRTDGVPIAPRGERTRGSDLEGVQIGSYLVKLSGITGLSPAHRLRRGDRLDAGLAVECLMQRYDRERDGERFRGNVD